ncbi:MAG: GXWXG domain-containing protein, partial [Marmoricola sp.]
MSGALLRQLADSGSTPAELDAIWASLEPARAETILGRYQGRAIPTGHPLEKALVRSRWWGKEFRALDDVSPLLCRDDAGEIFSNVELGNGEASLWQVEFRGEVTATMVY